jgi:heat-inducible transcriptional repressor
MSERELADRKLAVLRVVVEEYVRTGEPVGSETVAEHSSLGVSPATIRNELSALEEMGYLSHPHTSAGRIPTDLGYRIYVNSLPAAGKLRDTQRRAISDFFDDAVVDLEETLRGATQLLGRLTQQAGLATAPTILGERVVHVELVSMGQVVMVLVVGQQGRVDKRVLERPQGLDESTVTEMSGRLAEAFRGSTVAEAEARALRMAAGSEDPTKSLLTELADAFHEMYSGDRSGHVMVGGVTNLATEAARWHRETILRLFEALERETEMLLLLREATLHEDELSVLIGGEHPSTELWDASVVAAPYRVGGTSLGTIGVVGPTRMDYQTTIAAVRAVANRLTELASALEE